MKSSFEPERGDDCATALELLPLHVGGDLDPIESREVERHLEHCGPCRVAAERLSNARQRFFEVGLSSAAEELGARGLWAGIEAALERERRELRRTEEERVVGRAEPSRGDRSASERRRAAADESELHEARGAVPSGSGPVEAAPPRGGTGWIDGAHQGLTDTNNPGRRALRLLAGTVVVTAAALLVALVVSQMPQEGAAGAGDLTAELDPQPRDLQPLDLGANADVDAARSGDLAESGLPTETLGSGGFERLTPEDGSRRLVLQPRELESGALRGGREALVGYPSWR